MASKSYQHTSSISIFHILSVFLTVLLSLNSAYACEANKTSLRFTPNSAIPSGGSSDYVHVVNYTLSLPDGCGIGGFISTNYGTFELYDATGARIFVPYLYQPGSGTFPGIQHGYNTLAITKQAYYGNVLRTIQPGRYRIVASIRYHYNSTNGVRSSYESQVTYFFNVGDTNPNPPTPTPRPTTPPVTTPIVPFIPPYAKVDITNIADGQIVSGTIPVNFTITNIRAFEIRGVDISAYTGVLDASVRSIQLDTRLMPEGRRSIAVRVIGLDMRGHTAYFFGNVTLDVRNGTTNPPTPAPDNSAPVIRITGLENNQIISNKHKFSVNVSDNGTLKSLQINGFGQTLVNKSFSPGRQTNTEEFEVDTTQFENKTYEINVTVTDNEDKSTHAVRVFEISNTAGGTVPTTPPVITPLPQNTPAPEVPNNPDVNTLATLIKMLSEMMAQLTELMKVLLKSSTPVTSQANIAKSVANSLAEVAKVNKVQFESNEQTKLLPDQTKNMKKSINKALKQAQKHNDKNALKAARKELNKANRQLKKVVQSLK